MPGLEDLDLRLLLLERRRLAVDGRRVLRARRRRGLSSGVPEHVEEAAERRRADGHRDRRAGVDGGGAAAQAVGRVHREAAHPVVAEVLLDLGDERLVAVRDLDRVEQLRQVAGRELDVDDGADDLRRPCRCLRLLL